MTERTETDQSWRRRDRFTEHPETVEGEVSHEFITFLLHVHPDHPYSSEAAALLCRQAYDIGKRDGREGVNQNPVPAPANDLPMGDFL
jgi:hypothetical protein